VVARGPVAVPCLQAGIIAQSSCMRSSPGNACPRWRPPAWSCGSRRRPGRRVDAAAWRHGRRAQLDRTRRVLAVGHAARGRAGQVDGPRGGDEGDGSKETPATGPWPGARSVKPCAYRLPACAGAVCRSPSFRCRRRGPLPIWKRWVSKCRRVSRRFTEWRIGGNPQLNPPKGGY
jgi:hypothetical protein